VWPTWHAAWPHAERPAAPATLARACTGRIGYFVLLALLLNWLTWLSPPRGVPVALALVLLTVPLLFPLRGLLHGRPYTHAWTSFLALLYFAFGIDAVAAGHDPAWLGAVAIGSPGTGLTGLQWTPCDRPLAKTQSPRRKNDAGISQRRSERGAGD